MTVAATTSTVGRLSILVSVAAIAVALITGVALKQRGPDLSVIPKMAARPVIMDDGRALYVQRYEVTVAEWNRCAYDGPCELTLRVKPDQNPATIPATGLSYVDVQQYLSWVNRRSGQDFRLPTATEWERMAAAVLPEAPAPLFSDPSLTWASSYLVEGAAPRALRPQGSFSISPEGVADLDGSVWEWTMECYDGVSTEGEANRCPAFFVGGEHIAAMSYLVRDPARGGCAVGTPPAHLGMRLVSDDAI